MMIYTFDLCDIAGVVKIPAEAMDVTAIASGLIEKVCDTLVKHHTCFRDGSELNEPLVMMAGLDMIKCFADEDNCEPVTRKWIDLAAAHGYNVSILPGSVLMITTEEA